MENLSPNSMRPDWYRCTNSVQKVTGLIREQRIDDADLLSIALATSVHQQEICNVNCPTSVNKYSDDADIISASCGQKVSKQLFSDDHPMENEWRNEYSEPVDEEVSVPTIDKSQLKIQLKTTIATAIDYQLVSILNNGSYEELVQLRGIGPIRASRIMSERISKSFSTTRDLESIGMKSKEIQKFINDNVKYLLL